MIRFLVIDYKKSKSFNMKFEGFGFQFKDNGAFCHPFFCKEERMREIAQIIFQEDSELINTPKKHMSFENGQIEVIMLD